MMLSIKSTIRNCDCDADGSIEDETETTGVQETKSFFTYEKLEEIAKFLRDKVPYVPKIGIICGSGLGSLADSLTDPIMFPYEKIPHFPVSTVPGHAGKLVFGYIRKIPVVCMQGRFHPYEGYPLWKCSMPVRVMKLIGVTHLIATNAAGGMNPEYRVGDIMLIRDHINMMGFAGNNPLQGPNDERFGPRFPPMNKAYNADLIEKAKSLAAQQNIAEHVHVGVYTCVGGPNFETIAELRMLHMVGADAVGMSTVHEVITAKHCGLCVFAFSLISNACIMDYEKREEASHKEVMAAGKMREDMLKTFVSGMVGLIGEEMQEQDCRCFEKS